MSVVTTPTISLTIITKEITITIHALTGIIALEGTLANSTRIADTDIYMIVMVMMSFNSH